MFHRLKVSKYSSFVLKHKANLSNGSTLVSYPPVQRQHVRDSIMVQSHASFDLDEQGNPRLPKNYERVLAALIYIIPCLDVTALTMSLFKWWTSVSWMWFIMEPIITFYFSSAFTPLIIFFVIFIVIVRNVRLHHFVRFHAMQAVMIDIVTMLICIVRMYLPPEFRWSMFIVVLDRLLGMMVLVTIGYCVWHAIQGHYADVHYISDAVYLQVDMLESYGG